MSGLRAPRPAMGPRLAERVDKRLAAPPAPQPPSLVPSSESVHSDHGPICPRRPYLVQALERPELAFPASCDSYGCRICGTRKATQAAAVMTWALRNITSPSRARFFTLTLADQDFPVLRQKVRNARRILVAEGFDWETAWAREAGSLTGMLHIHGVQHGRHKVPQDRLQDLWGARVDIRAVRGLRDRSGAAAYTVKEAMKVCGYSVKGATGSPDALADHLALNGGRPAHWSRGFLHGKTKRDALTAIRAEMTDGEDLTWRLVPAWRSGSAPTVHDLAPAAATAAKTSTSG